MRQRVLITLPSRGRPENVARFIEAYKATDAECDVAIRIDNDDVEQRGYRALDLPTTFSLTCAARVGCARSMTELHSWNPGYDAYGLVCDDVVPETRHWDRLLADACGRGGIAFGDDGMHGPRFATHPFIGADMIEAVGFYMPPGFNHFYIDDVWNDIGKATGRLHYMENVKMTHMHWSNGKADRATYQTNGLANGDRLKHEAWKIEELPAITERIIRHGTA